MMSAIKSVFVDSAKPALLKYVRQSAQQAFLLEITPELATELLARSPGNRRKRKRKIASYAASITAGWKVNGSTVVLDADGRLLDGHHRMEACVLANESFTTWVIIGVARAAFVTFDVGAARSPGDTLHVAALMDNTAIATDEKALAGALRLWENYSRGTLAPGSKWRTDVSNDRLLALHKEHGEMAKYVAYVCGSRKLRAMLAPSATAFCMYVFSRIDADLGHLFMESVETGTQLHVDDPAYVLRERLLKERQSVARSSTGYLIALMLKAWNLTRQGRKCKALVWRSESEPFPVAE